MAIGIGIGLTFGRRKGIDAQAQAAFNSLQSAGFTTPQGITGINAAFKTIKTIYGTSDITTAISFFGDPSLAYQIGAGSGTTLGQAIRTLPNIIDPTRATDAVQTTAASQPLLLVHSGANYWFGSGVTGNFVSTPNAAANNIVNDIEVVFCAEFGNTFTQSLTPIYSKGESWAILLYNNRQIRFFNHATGAGVYATQAIPSDAKWVKITRNSSNGDVIFFTSTNSINTNISSVSYTQLGSTVSFTSGALAGSTQLVTIGMFGSSNWPFTGKIYRITVANSIGGAPVVDFNPNQYNPSTSQTQWTSSTGEVWTINTGTATTGYKGVLVDRTIIQGDGIDDILTKTENIMAQFTVFNSNRGFAGAGNQGLLGRNGFNNLALIYDSATQLTVYKEGAFNYGSLTISRLNLLTIAYNSTSLQALVNNVQQINNISGTLITQGITHLFRGRTANSNALINTHIEVSIKSNSTQQTSMYNYIRSINNNAF